jgi:hypothetical protein
LAGSSDVLEELLKIDELEPHLIDAREERDRPVVEVPGMLNIAGFKFL